MEFINNLKRTLDNTSLTENGAIGYVTTDHALTDFNFKIPSYRKDKENLIKDFNKVLEEKDPYALRYLFYLRDVRGGLGERDAFRLCLINFLETCDSDDYDTLYNILSKIPEYGRWDDIVYLMDSKNKLVSEIVIDIIEKQLSKDIEDASKNNRISLLAKWLPSDNASSTETKRKAKKLCQYLNLTKRDYRKMIVMLRKYLDITEIKTCANNWDDIDYNKVSSNANLRYSDAFMKHDEDRRIEYLHNLVRGDKNTVMHSATNFPHDIVHRYTKETFSWENIINDYDEATEQLWKNLPEMEGLGDTLVVRDGSGSMRINIPGSNVSALDIADGLAIYCSERCKGQFKNNFITFSATPQLVDLSKHNSLHAKLWDLRENYDDYTNTDLEATFELVLRTAVENKMTQDDLPKQLLVISDMEFDDGVGSKQPLMEKIRFEFEQYGYKLPKLVFWNVNSRTNTIPMQKNDSGVLLVSGFSLQTINMVNSGELDPYKAIIAELDKDRYNCIPLLKI